MKFKSVFILSSALLVLLTYACSAQTQFGLEAGLNLSTEHFAPPPSAFTTNITVSNKVGGKIGGIVVIPIAKNIYLQTGLFYSMKGADASGGSREIKYAYDYLELPIFAEYHIKHLVFGAGPYIGYAIHGKAKQIDPSGTSTENIPIGSTAGTDGLKAMDAGINLKAKYQFTAGLFLSLQYGFGLANIEPSDGITQRNRVFCISAGYMFGKKAKQKPGTSPAHAQPRYRG